LLVVELVIVGESVVAMKSGLPADARSTSGPHLAEGGAHQTFRTSAHPALTVDIGYADLTIQVGEGSQVDVSVSAGMASNIFHSNGPIAASADGDAVRIAKSGSGWSGGDDRMVTVIVPAQTLVTVVRAGDIKASGLRADASISSVGSGTINVEDYDAASLHVNSSNGAITLRRIVATRLIATSRNDRVDASGLQVRDGSIEGDDNISLGFAPGTNTVVNAEASDGKVSLSGFSATASGTESKPSGEDSVSQTVHIGAAGGHLDVHSHSGDIRLRQEG